MSAEPQHSARRPHRCEAGLSLVELLVATALGLIVIAVVTTLFVKISRTNREMARTGNQIEGARFALQILKEDVVHAGFWGRFVPQFDDITRVKAPPADVPDRVPDPCEVWGHWAAADARAEIDARLGIPVQVHDAVPAGCTGFINDHLAGTDILVVRHAETCSENDVSCNALAAEELAMAAPTCTAQLQGEVVEIDGEVVSTFFDAGPTPYVLDDSTADPAMLMDCKQPAPRRRFQQSIYYIRSYSVDEGDGVPTLMRSRFGLDSSSGENRQLSFQALVPGIQNLQVELGFDTVSEMGQPVDYSEGARWQANSPSGFVVPAQTRDQLYNRGDGVPDVQPSGDLYVSCSEAAANCGPGQLANVVLVRLHILARATEPSPGFTDNKSYRLGALSVPPAGDNFKRHVFSNTVRLHNVAGRRETP